MPPARLPLLAHRLGLTCVMLALAPSAGAEVPHEVLKPRAWVAPMAALKGPGVALVASRVEEAARQEIAKIRGARIIRPGQKVLRFKWGERDPRVSQAENLRTSGQAAFGQGDLNGAQANLDAALKLYELALASVRRVDAIGRALAFRAAVAAARGEKGAVTAYLRDAALLSQEIDEPIEGLPEALQKKLTKLVRKVRRGRGRLTIRTVPPKANIRVNGVDRGLSPVKLKRLAKGHYYIQAEHPDGLAASARVHVGRRAGKALLKLRAELGPREPLLPSPGTVAALKSALLADKPASALEEPAATAAKHLNVEHLILARIGPAEQGFEVRGYVYGIVQKHLEPVEPIVLGPNLSTLLRKVVDYGRNLEVALAKVDQMPAAKKRRKRRRRRRR